MELHAFIAKTMKYGTAKHVYTDALVHKFGTKTVKNASAPLDNTGMDTAASHANKVRSGTHRLTAAFALLEPTGTDISVYLVQVDKSSTLKL